jgi:hypothetical protein
VYVCVHVCIRERKKSDDEKMFPLCGRVRRVRVRVRRRAHVCVCVRVCVCVWCGDVVMWEGG